LRKDSFASIYIDLFQMLKSFNKVNYFMFSL